MGGVTYYEAMHQLFERPPEHQWGFNKPEEIEALRRTWWRNPAPWRNPPPPPEPDLPRTLLHLIPCDPPRRR